MSEFGAEAGKPTASGDTDAVDIPSSKQIDVVEWFQKKIAIAFVLTLSCAVHWSFMSNFYAPLAVQHQRSALLFLEFVLMTVFYVAEVMFLYSYFLCMFTPPGSIPKTAEWVWSDLALESNRVMLEKKQTDGARRFCRWCALYKPDRAHHCRRCGQCILKMDHHCAWIDNCVGFKNHKFFFLTILYASFDIIIFAAMRLFGTGMAIIPDTSDVWCLLNMGLDIVTALFATSFIAFFLLHVFLMSRAETTLEFRERSGSGLKSGKGLFDQGSAFANFCAVLGPTIWLWFVPVFNTPGDGTCWINDTESNSFRSDAGSPHPLSPVCSQAGQQRTPMSPNLVYSPGGPVWEAGGMFGSSTRYD